MTDCSNILNKGEHLGRLNIKLNSEKDEELDVIKFKEVIPENLLSCLDNVKYTEEDLTRKLDEVKLDLKKAKEQLEIVKLEIVRNLGDDFEAYLKKFTFENKKFKNREQAVRTIGYFRDQKFKKDLNKIVINCFINYNLSINYIKKYIKNFSKEIFNCISLVEYVEPDPDHILCKVKKVPRCNHGGLNHLRSLKFGVNILKKIIIKSKSDNNFNIFFPSIEFLIILTLSTMFESVLRVNEDGSSGVLITLDNPNYNELFPGLSNIYNNPLSSHQLASSIFFINIMKKCFKYINKDIISDKDIILLGKAVSYFWDTSYNTLGIGDTLPEKDGIEEKHKFFVWYVILISGHYLDHCRGQWSPAINNPHITRLLNLFKFTEQEKIEIVQLVVDTLQRTEFKGDKFIVESSSNMKYGTCSSFNLGTRFEHPDFVKLSFDFEFAYETLELDREIQELYDAFN